MAGAPWLGMAGDMPSHRSWAIAATCAKAACASSPRVDGSVPSSTVEPPLMLAPSTALYVLEKWLPSKADCTISVIVALAPGDELAIVLRRPYCGL